MTETPATLLAVAGLVCLASCQRPVAAGAVGIVLALAILCRPTFLPWLGLCTLVVSLHPQCRPQRLANTLVLIGCAAVVLSPWMVRNHRQTGRLRITTTHGGYTLLLGNNPSFYRYLKQGARGSTWNSDELVEAWVRRGNAKDPQDPLWADLALAREAQLAPSPLASENEDDADQFAYALAKRYVREQPGMFLYSCWVRFGRFWQPAPHQLDPDESSSRRLFRYAVGAWYAALFLVTGVGLFVLRGKLFSPPWVWGVLLCATFTAVHCLYWSNMRMRAPVMPFVYLVALRGAQQVLAWRQRRN